MAKGGQTKPLLGKSAKINRDPLSLIGLAPWSCLLKFKLNIAKGVKSGKINLVGHPFLSKKLAQGMLIFGL